MKVTESIHGSVNTMLMVENSAVDCCTSRDFSMEAPHLVLWREIEAVEIHSRISRGRQWTFQPAPGTFELYQPGDYSYYRASAGRRRGLFLSPSPDWYRSAGMERGFAPTVLSRMNFRSTGLQRLVLAFAEHSRAGEPLGQLYSESLAAAISSYFHETNSGLKGRDMRPSQSRVIEELIEGRLMDPPSLLEMSSMLGMGITLFVRAFRSRFGTTPHQYLIMRRIDRAKGLLAGTDNSVSEIALELGFSSHAHLSAVFKMRTGASPSEYRSAATRSVLQSRGHAPRCR